MSNLLPKKPGEYKIHTYEYKTDGGFLLTFLENSIQYNVIKIYM